MSRSVFEIAFKFIKEGGGDRQTLNSIKALKSGWMDMVGIAGAVTGAFFAIKAGIDATVGPLVTLAGEVERFHNLTGMTVEDSSRVKEVFEDMGIGMDTAATAFRNAAKNGFEPTIDNLIAMQAEYLALEPGIERVNFLTDTFGAKSGASLQKFFEAGDAAQRLAGVSAGKILSEDDLRAVQEYKDAVDDLGDSWAGLKNEAGQALLPILTWLVDKGNAGVQAWSGMNTQIDDMRANLARANAVGKDISWVDKMAVIGATEFQAISAGTSVIAAQAEVVDVATSGWIGMGNAYATAAKQQEWLANGGVDLYEQSAVNAGIAGKLGDAWDDYRVKMEPLIAEHAALATELARVKDHYPGWTGKINELTGALAENDAKQRDLAASTRATTTEFIFQQASAGLTGQALYELAHQMGVLDDTSYYAALAVQHVRNEMDPEKNPTQFAAAIAEVNDAIQWLLENGDKSITLQAILDVIARWTNEGAPPPPGIGTTPGEQANQPERREATGGPVSAGTPYLINENAVTAPEWFVPSVGGYVLNKQDAMAAMGGGAMVVQANDAYSPGILDQLVELNRRMDDLPGQFAAEIEKRK